MVRSLPYRDSATVLRRLIIGQNIIAGGHTPAHVRRLLFAVFLVCSLVPAFGARQVSAADAGANSASSPPNVVSKASSTPAEATVPGKSELKQQAPGEKVTTAGTVTTSGTGTTGQPPTGGEGSEQETVVDVVHAEVSHTLQGTATWMDSFFGNRRYLSEQNESYVRFRYNAFFEKGSPSYIRPDLQVRIVLPQLRDQWHLVFAGTPKETTDFSAVQTGAPEGETAGTAGEKQAVAALDRTFLQSAQQNFSVRTGFRLSNFKPVVLVGPRYRVTFPLDSWTLRLIEELDWTSNAGFANQATVDLERPLPSGLFFRSSAAVVHTEHQVGSTYAVSFIVGQPLSRLKAVSYEWINICQTEPVNELVEVDLRVRYRTRLWRDWLYFEVSPQYRFPRTLSFKATPGILFRIEMTVGNYERFLPKPGAQ